MTSLDRRELLLASTLGACAPLAWLAEALGAQEPSPRKRTEKRRDLLRNAARRARDEGRPLLVLLLPADLQAQTDRGLALGRWLTSERVEDRLDLGLAELACATASEVKRVLGPVALHHEPALLWAEVAGFESEGAPAPRVIPLGPTLESFAHYSSRVGSNSRGPVEAWDGFTQAQSLQLAAALQSALAAPERSLSRLAELVGEKLEARAREQMESWIATNASTEPELLRRATAWIRQRRAALPAERAEDVDQRLGEAIATSIRSTRIPGSAWAKHASCGWEVIAPRYEDEPGPNSFLCGMSSAPPSACRFLWFWNELPPPLHR